MDDDFRSIGIFLVTFLLLPSLLNNFALENEIDFKNTEKSIFTSLLGSIAKKNNILIFVVTFIIFVASISGITKLEVENSFINYFDEETEIYKGMKKIDEDLGGTTPSQYNFKIPINQYKKSQ